MAVCIKFADDWIRTAHNWHERQATGLPAETQPLAAVYLPTSCDVTAATKKVFRYKVFAHSSETRFVCQESDHCPPQ